MLVSKKVPFQLGLPHQKQNSHLWRADLTGVYAVYGHGGGVQRPQNHAVVNPHLITPLATGTLQKRLVIVHSVVLRRRNYDRSLVAGPEVWPWEGKNEGRSGPHGVAQLQAWKNVVVSFGLTCECTTAVGRKRRTNELCNALCVWNITEQRFV